MFSLANNCIRSMQIKKGKRDLKAIVSDFKTWSKWSSWLCQDKECKVKIEGSPGKFQHKLDWDGKIVGAGKTELIGMDEDSISFDLNILKPWKSQSKVVFRFDGDDKNCLVTWELHGSLPLFMFFFKKLLQAILGQDLNRGLLMLKDLAETGKVLSEVSAPAEVEKPGFHYIGKRNICDISQLGPAMEKDFAEFGRMVGTGIVPKPIKYVSLYHKFDFVKQKCEFTSALTYAEHIHFHENGFSCGEIEPHRAAQVIHTGSYKYLGNAWSATMAYQRYFNRKVHKRVPMYEIYVTNPGEVEESKNLTEINVPLR